MSDQTTTDRKLVLAAVSAAVLFVGCLIVFLSGDASSPEAANQDTDFRPVTSLDSDGIAATSPNNSIEERVELADQVVGNSAEEDERSETVTGTDKAVVKLQGGHEVEVPADSPAARANEARKAAERLEAEAMNNPGPMGPGNWSAPISPEEEAEIQAAFDALPEPDPRVSRADRKTSIEVARAVVEQCYRDLEARQPGRKGRVAVAWMAMASGGEGVIAEPEITLNLKLRDPAFERCIVQGLDGLTFTAAEPGEPLRVEYPFFFDR